jgi:hypothetical protein
VPGAAPDLHPDEGLWNELKPVERTHRGCRERTELTREVRRATERLRHKRAIITACSPQCGYSVEGARSTSVRTAHGS